MTQDRLRVVVPEDFGRQLSIGVFNLRDLFIFIVIFVMFIAIALMIPNAWIELFIVIAGFIFAAIFAFWKVDHLDTGSYLSLKFRARHKTPNFPPLYLYDETTLFNGSAYFRIIEVTNGVPFDFISEGDKIAILKTYEQMLNACDFPLQFVVKTRKVRPEAFDKLIREKSELAEGYKKLIHKFTENLYIQFYYVVVPVFTWELKSPDEKVRYRRARDMLDIRTKVVVDYLNQLGVGGRVVKGKSRIYEVIRSSVS